MNLYFRLIWTLIRALRLPRLEVGDVLEREFRVMPNDLDINRHMNNGRYLTMVDLMIVEFFARTGFLKVLLRNKWYPVIGGACISYRRELGFAQKFTLRFQRVASDTHWNYLQFEFIDEDGRICATGYSKGAAKSRNGLVPNEKSYAAMGLTPYTAPLPPAIAHWIESERALVG